MWLLLLQAGANIHIDIWRHMVPLVRDRWWCVFRICSWLGCRGTRVSTHDLLDQERGIKNSAGGRLLELLM